MTFHKKIKKHFIWRISTMHMKIYDEKHLKNIVLSGAPKAGITHRRGTIEDKNTVSDFHEIEYERGNSVFGSVIRTIVAGL